MNIRSSRQIRNRAFKITWWALAIFMVAEIELGAGGTNESLVKAKELIQQKQYAEAAGIFERVAPQYIITNYDKEAWSVFYNLGYAYQELSLEGETNGYVVETIKKQNLVDKAKSSFRKAIAVDRLRTDGHVEISSPIFLADLELMTKDLEQARICLVDLESRMTHVGLDFKTSDDQTKKLLAIIRKLAVPVVKEARLNQLDGNIIPFGFAYIQINPTITLESREDLPFAELLENDVLPTSIKIRYASINGVKTGTLAKVGSLFKFDQPILLKRSGWFPFDAYSVSLYDIDPPLIQKKLIPLSMFQSTPFIGTVAFNQSTADIRIVRNPVSIFFYYLCFTGTIVMLWILNRGIRNMRSASFQFSNLSPVVTFLAGTIGFLFFALQAYDWSSALNAHNIFLCCLIALTVWHLVRRYRSLLEKQ